MHPPQPILAHTLASGADRMVPLTNQQMLFWLGQQLHPGLPIYNIAFAYTLPGPLEPEVFARAFQDVVDRYDALRTAIAAVEGVPQQRVQATYKHAVEFIDVRHAPDPEAACRTWVAARTRQALALDERLFDTALIRLAPDRHVWYLCQHHIITDGMSMALTFQAVGAAYTARLAGQAPDAADEVDAFQDYVAHEVAARQTKLYQRAEAYRRQKLETSLPAIAYYNPAPPARTAAEHRRVVPLGAARTARLKALATSDRMPVQQEQQALFNIVTTLLFAYLYRVSGHRSLSLGMIFHNRLTPAAQRAVGLFVTLFPLQVQVQPGETYLTLVRKVMVEWLAALRYAPYCVSNPGRQQAYDVLLNFLPMAYGGFAGRPASVDWLHAGVGDAQHSLSLHVHDFDALGNLKLVFDFNDGVFTPAHRDRAVADVLALLDHLLEDPEHPLTAYPLVAVEAVPQQATPAVQRTQDAYVAPGTPLEAELAGLWSEVLGIEQVGVTDNFFALGGHSLLLVQVHHRLVTRHGIDVPVLDLFQHPTVGALARHLGRRIPDDGPLDEARYRAQQKTEALRRRRRRVRDGKDPR